VKGFVRPDPYAAMPGDGLADRAAQEIMKRKMLNQRALMDAGN
jgi:hypothetical protein